MGKHDANDYEGKHVREDDWKLTWDVETRGGGNSTGCAIPIAMGLLLLIGALT